MQAFRLGLRILRGAAASSVRRPAVRPVSFRPVPRPRPLQQKRFASRYQRFGDQQYSSFRPAARAQFLWRNYQTPILVVGGAGGTFYVYNLEQVPVTHRRRFNCISPEIEKKLVEGAGYEDILKQFQGKILPADHPYTKLVARVVERLLPSTGGLAGDEWVVHVIDEPKEKNAFVIPGGKVFVFSGILPICQDENGVATVLAHEIAHNVAHHAAERISRSVFALPIVFLFASIFDVSGQLSQTVVDLVLSLPNSRTQEAEADHIGLLMMAESCYDPNSAVEFWGRMQQAEKYSPPQFLSTHPSSHNRMDTIRKWLPEANEKLEESECGITKTYAEEFNKTFGARQSVPQGPQPIGRQTQSKDNDDFF